MQVFNVLKSTNPENLNKLECIEGDCVEENLGISPESFEKMKNVSIIIHSAASIKFDDSLKKVLLMHVRGTRDICRFAEKLSNLECMVYVSTSYSNALNEMTEERV